MTRYAVSYTTGSGEPEENTDGEEYVPEHAVPIVDGVAVTGPAPTVEDEARCTETTAAGKPCKGTPGDDGLCAAHRRQKEASGEDGPVAPAAEAAGADPRAEEDGEAEEGDGEEAGEEEA